MPNITKQFHIDITPERFLDACTAEELQELDLLLGKPKYQEKMNPLSKEKQIILEDQMKFHKQDLPRISNDTARKYDNAYKNFRK